MLLIHSYIFSSNENNMSNMLQYKLINDTKHISPNSNFYFILYLVTFNGSFKACHLFVVWVGLYGFI